MQAVFLGVNQEICDVSFRTSRVIPSLSNFHLNNPLTAFLQSNELPSFTPISNRRKNDSVMKIIPWIITREHNLEPTIKVWKIKLCCWNSRFICWQPRILPFSNDPPFNNVKAVLTNTNREAIGSNHDRLRTQSLFRIDDGDGKFGSPILRRSYHTCRRVVKPKNIGL